jgi:membrane protein implicated in regulation of membrane protease activity
VEGGETVTAASSNLLRRLRLSGLLVSLGLIIEAVTLLWSHPTAFLVFLLLGATLVAAGVLFYLFSIVSSSSPPRY